MYLTLVAFLGLSAPFILTETNKKESTNEIVFEQNNMSKFNVNTKIIYTKAPTPWVKVFNN